jgi:L-malate glycosyltransferase
MKRVDQWVPALHRGDAIGDSTLLVRDALRRFGYASDIYAFHRDDGLDALPFSAFLEGETSDAVILHYALVSPMDDAFKTLRSRKILQHHNITPPHFYAAWDQEIARSLELGRRGLRKLAPVADFGLGDSDFNRRELEDLGFPNTGVLPILLDFDRYREDANAAVRHRYADGRTNLLFVGRIAPNKRHDQLLRLLAYYKKYITPAVRLLAVGKAPRRETGGLRPIEAHYQDALIRLYSELGLEPSDVVFTGGVTHDEMLAYYEAAHVFISMSEHEGFGVPLVEAMLKDVPIVAFTGTAVGETLGSAGIQFDHQDIAAFAEAAALLARTGPARDFVLRAQRARASDFGPETTLVKLRGFLESLS